MPLKQLARAERDAGERRDVVVVEWCARRGGGDLRQRGGEVGDRGGLEERRGHRGDGVDPEPVGLGGEGRRVGHGGGAHVDHQPQPMLAGRGDPGVGKRHAFRDGQGQRLAGRATDEHPVDPRGGEVRRLPGHG